MSDSLQHYGVPGMRWGRRGGGRSSEAPKKVPFKSSETGEQTKGKYKSNSSSDHVKAREAAKKSPNQLSNQEMQALITRMNLEQQYAKLNPTPTARGQKIALDITKKAGTKLVSEVVNQSISMAVKAGFDAIKS